MFNGIAASIERAAQPDPTISLAGNFSSPTMSLVHNRLYFFERERGLRNQFPVLADPRPERHIHLDPIRAVAELFARRLARLDRPIDELCALGHIQLRSIASQPVPAR